MGTHTGEATVVAKARSLELTHSRTVSRYSLFLLTSHVPRAKVVGLNTHQANAVILIPETMGSVGESLLAGLSVLVEDVDVV